MLFTPRLGLAWSCGGKIEIVAQGTEQGGGGLGPRGVGCRLADFPAVFFRCASIS